MRVISFDIDGTMSFGDPPGHITPDLVRRVRALGVVVGSCSDRTLAEQAALWRAAGVEVDFVALKHRLDDVKRRFDAAHYLHVGDTDTDYGAAHRAGFAFLWVHQVPADGGHEWLLGGGAGLAPLL